MMWVLPTPQGTLTMSAENEYTMNETLTVDSPASSGRRMLGVGMLAVGIAAGAMFAPATFAGAQDDADAPEATETETPDADAPESDAAGGDRGSRSDRGAALKALGIDAETIQAGIDADQSFVQIAEANGASEAELIAEIEAGIESRLADAVASGRITQEQADEKAVEITTMITERVNMVPSEQPERSGRGHHGARGGFGGSEVLEELGLTAEDIQAGRFAGQTLAETAAANGVSEADLIDALVAQATERADAAVESGGIDADKAAEMLDGLDERITEKVNAEPGEASERGRHGQRGSQDDAEETSVSF